MFLAYINTMIKETCIKTYPIIKRRVYIILNTFNYNETVAPTLRFSMLQKYIIRKKKTCVVIWPEKNKGTLLNNLITCRKLLVFLCKNTKDTNTIIFRDTLISPFLAILKPIFRLEIYNEFHGYYHIELKNQKKKYLSHIAYIFDKISTYIADKILSVSMGLSQSQINQYANKTILVPNWIDKEVLTKTLTTIELDDRLDMMIKKDSNEIKIWFAGNAAEWFNLEEVIDEVWNQSQISLYIIGKWYNFDYLKSKIKISNYTNIKFIDNLVNTQTILFLNQMSVLITPYNFDFPFSNIPYFFSSKKNKEYIFLRKPILMPDVPWIDYIFKDELWICKYHKVKWNLLKNIKKLEKKEFYQEKIKELQQLDNQIDFYDILDTSRLF